MASLIWIGYGIDLGKDGWGWFGGATAAIVVDAARELRYPSIVADSGEMRRYDASSSFDGGHRPDIMVLGR